MTDSVPSQRPTVVAPIHATLADGRELFYFDDVEGTRHDAVDRRVLDAGAAPSQLRWDPLSREWTIIAGHRQQRTFRPATADCPLCPSRGEDLTEIPEAQFAVVVFENRFPSLTASSVTVHPRSPVETAPERGIPRATGGGRCEVMVYTDSHTTPFPELSPRRVVTVVNAWAHRTADLRTRSGVAFVYCFENRGDEIGVTLAHPHGQIYAYPFLPPRIEQAARVYREAASQGLDCPQCTILANEVSEGSRVVLASDHWVAYVPFAAKWPYEVRLVPRRHLGSIPELDDDERADLARTYQAVLAKFDHLWDQPAPYIAGWDQAPCGNDDQPWHLSAHVFTIRRAADKLKYLAGSESGAGVWINDIAPETAAERLRNAG